MTNLTQLDENQKIRIRAILISIGAGVLILTLKTVAYLVSGSAALKSDAIESIVNVVAAVFALGAVIFAHQPADEEHPYGHGKIEHFSAAFEGGLISFAAVFIMYEAVKNMIFGYEIKDLGLGLAINVGAGMLNGLLGLFLIRTGRKYRSHALEADGHHVISDFFTTIGIACGLLIVTFTGIAWLDSVMALGVGALLAVNGFKLVRDSSRALLDSEDPDLIRKLLETFNRIRPSDLVAVHGLRTLRAGRYVHVDVHVVVPEFYPVRQGHDLAEDLEKAVLKDLGEEGEFHSHLDPCGRNYCRNCLVAPCPIRRFPFEARRKLVQEEAILPAPVVTAE